MKRVLLIASAFLIVIAVYVLDTSPGITQALTAQMATGVTAAPTSRPVPETSIVDQDAPYLEACAREGLSDSACVGRLIWYKATAGNDLSAEDMARYSPKRELAFPRELLPNEIAAGLMETS